jgi:hypothetical protein
MAYNLRKLYGIAFTLGTVALGGILYMYDFQIGLLINASFVLLLATVSGVIMKFMGGLGIMLTYASVASFVFRFFSNAMRKDETTANRVKTLLVLPILAIAIYGFYKLVTAIFFSSSLSLIEIVVSLFGIWSLVYFIYLGPAFIGKYEPRFDELVIIDSVRDRLSDVRHSIWKGYQLRIHGGFGEVYADEFDNYQTDIEEIRVKLSGLLLFPMCIVLLMIPPIAGIGFALWLRTFSLHHQPLTRFERAILVIMVSAVVAISTYVFFFLDTSNLILFLDSSYAIGIFTSILLLLWVVYKA